MSRLTGVLGRGLLVMCAFFGGNVALADFMDDRVEAILKLGDAQKIADALQADFDQGNLKAGHELGTILLGGRGVKPDPARSLELFEEAGQPRYFRYRYKRGYPESQFQAGYMHENGIGTSRDLAAAAKWYGRAADQGHGQAQLALGTLLATESYPERDPEKAYFWLALAADAWGLKEEERKTIAKQMSALEKKLPRGSVPGLKRSVSEWKPAVYSEF
jgi:hypothetical protein